MARKSPADKLTDRALAEIWRYQKARDQLNPAWDGDSWEGLTKRQQSVFAKSEEKKKADALSYLTKVMPKPKR